MAIPVQATPDGDAHDRRARGSPVAEGSTIWRRGQWQLGSTSRSLCHDERFDPVGVCRMCVVDVGAPAYAAVLRAARAKRAWTSRPPPRRSSAAARC